MKVLKKIFVLLILIIILIFGYKFYNYLKIKNAKIEVTLKDNLDLVFMEYKKVSDYIESINGKIVNDYVIDSTKIGKKKVSFSFINDDKIKVSYSYNVNVIDNMSPLVWLGESYTINKGDDTLLADKIICVDNYDKNPNCVIEGEYDYNVPGSYNLVFKATDSSLNETKKDFTLNVIEKSNSNNKTSNSKIYFSDILKEYKTNNNKIGIDISKWQENIDFKAIKDAGCEFVMIRVGLSKKGDNTIYEDEMFEKNVKGAIENNLPVGVYFYSNAVNEKQAKKEATWVLNKIKKYDITLPVAFDWENFSNFNEFNLSLFDLDLISKEFTKEVNKKGYKTVLYGSKNYLNNMWIYNKEDIWLAHYTKETDYDKKYVMWQLCENGVINGIKDTVDIDIMYE